MRSRYTAFVLHEADYLLATWDPAHRPGHLSLKQDRTEWLGLQIIETEAGSATDVTGRVHFIARFRLDGKEQALAENSRFRKDADRWLYIDGEVAPTEKPGSAPATAARPSTGRNEPCPCNSGLKFKRCCGK
jgi:SEC-C motif-containing protein